MLIPIMLTCLLKHSVTELKKQNKIKHLTCVYTTVTLTYLFMIAWLTLVSFFTNLLVCQLLM